MTQIINDAQELSDFAVKMQTLIGLLSDKKAVDYLVAGAGKASDIKAQKEAADAAQKAADKITADLDKKAELIAKQADETKALNEAAIKALADAQTAKIDAERTALENANAKKFLAEAVKKTAAAEQKAADKAVILDGKIAENNKLKAELQEAIASYNNAVGNLKAVKVA